MAIPSNNIAESIQWYQIKLGATIIYQDNTWGMIECGGQKIAFVSPQQHPPHLAFRVSKEELEAESKQAGVGIDQHRDGSRGIYCAGFVWERGGVDLL